MKTKHSSMWTWCAGLALAAGLIASAPQAQAAYSGTGNFTPITSTADITSGGYYVFVGGSTFASTAMGTFTPSILAIGSVATTSGTIVNPPTTNVWRIDGSASSWSIYNEAAAQYVGHNGTANAVSTAASTSARFLWTFATTVSSAFRIQNMDSTLRVLQYNSGSPRFAAYSSAQTPVRLYKMGASAPSVTTVAADTIAATSANANGNVTSDGGGTVTNRGACYKTSAGVTIADNKTQSGSGTGTFAVPLSSLSVNQIYYFVAYAQNSAGTTLGSETNFTTLANVPSAPTVNNPTSLSLDVAVNENGNPSATEFAIQCTNDSQYVQSDGTLGASAVWATKSAWGTKTVTGLSASTTYGFRVKARNGASVETAFGSAADGTTSAAASGIWINPMSAGTPMGTYNLGDTLGEWYVNFEIGQTTWNDARVGIGTSLTGSGYNFGTANWYEDGEGSNKRVRRNLSGIQFTSATSYYVICQAKANAEDAYTSKSGNGWSNSTAYPPADLSSAYFTVNALSNPSGLTAAKDGTYSATRVDLGWTQWSNKNVMITVATATPSGSPTNGHAYSASDTFGNQTVVSGSQSGSSLEVTGLTPGQTYYFTFYSENYSYYSAGATASSVTLDMPQARNTSGGSPEAPATIYLGDTGLTFGFDSWGQIEANYGAAQLWLRYNNADLTGGTAGSFGSFVNDEHKSLTSGLFNQTGTWYWGVRMDYGSPYGSNFWYKDSSAGWANLSSSGSGATLSVTVSGINDVSNPVATRSVSAPLSEIDLSWVPDITNHNVMIVRKLSTDSWTEPTQGAAYSVSDSIGSGTVIFNGQGMSTTATGLADGTTYDFKFYEVNNNYYSPGLERQASTLACEPDAPTGLYADPTNRANFTANWAAADRATGYRLDVSDDANFGAAGADLINDGFETWTNGWTTPAPGWTQNSATFNGNLPANAHSGSNSIGMNLAADWIQTPAVVNPGTLSFWCRTSSDPGDWTVIVRTSPDGTNWTDRATIVENGTGGTINNTHYQTNIVLDLTGTYYIRWAMTARTADSIYIDDVVLTPMATPSFVPGYENLAVAGTSQAVTGLTQETTYYFRVRAEGEGGCPSVNSTTASVTTLSLPDAVVELYDLDVTYDGTPKSATVVTDPEGLAVDVTYDGSGTPPTDAGDYEVIAAVNDENYGGAATGTLVIAKADQAISFPNPGDQWTTNTVELSASASSGLTVSFAVLSGPGSISGGTTLTFTGAGDVSIVASQAGNGNWNPAPGVTNTFTVRGRPVPVLSGTNVYVRENGEGRFFVRLGGAPTGSVVVTTARSGGDAGTTVLIGASRGFTPASWNDWQVVTLGAVDDANDTNEVVTFTVSTPGYADQVVTATVLDDDIGTNLALAVGGTVASSSEPNARPEQMIDGIQTNIANYGFSVVTSVPPTTLTVDLRVVTSVARIRLLTWDWTYLTHRYKVEASTNGTDWAVLLDASAEDHHGWDDWPVADVALRYLRFTGLDTTQDRDAVSVTELEVYGTRDLSGLPKAVISPADVNVREGGEGRFFVRLDKEPDVSTRVTISWFSGSTNVTILNGAVRVYKPTTWDIWQVVTLVAPEDANAVGETATFRVAIPGVADQFVEATVLDDEIGVNYALASGGATLASGTGASRAPQANDGIHTSSTNYAVTVWTNDPHGFITLDLKRSTSISRIRLLNWDWVHRLHRYTIEASTNGSSWWVLCDASAMDRQGWDDWIVPDVAARYLRFTGISNSANPYVVISELEVYGTLVPYIQPEVSKTAVNVREAGEGRFYVRLPSAPTGNVALTVSRISGDASLTIQSGSTRGFTPANWNVWQAVVLAQAADGNATGETAVFQVSGPNYADITVTATALDDDIAENVALATGGATITGWKANQVAQLIDGAHANSSNYGYSIWTNVPAGTITLDMHAAMTVSRVRLLNWDWNYRLQRYTIESSVNGSDWSVLADASAAGRHGWDDWAVADQSIRYLRFTGLSNSAVSQVVISELEVYGTRPLGRRSLKTSRTEAEVVTVMTSDDVAPVYESGWAALDGDADTAWVGQQAGGGYILVGFEPSLTLKALEVDLAEGSLAGIEYLYSADGQDWQPLPDDLKKNPVSLNFLWLVFPDDGTGAVPNVLEIRPNP